MKRKKRKKMNDSKNEDEDCKFEHDIFALGGDNLTPEEIELDREKERLAFLECCGSCSDFVSFYADAGMCRSEEGECCLCRNPKAMKDMFDPKCSRWKYNNDSPFI